MYTQCTHHVNDHMGSWMTWIMKPSLNFDKMPNPYLRDHWHLLVLSKVITGCLLLTGLRCKMMSPSHITTQQRLASTTWSVKYVHFYFQALYRFWFQTTLFNNRQRLITHCSVVVIWSHSLSSQPHMMRDCTHNFENSRVHDLGLVAQITSISMGPQCIWSDSSTQEACPAGLNLIGQGLSCLLTDWWVRNGRTGSVHTKADAN